MTNKIDGAAGHIEVDSKEFKHTPIGYEMKDWLTKFHDIEEKNKCLRVQFLDWLSDKLLDWSNKLHVMSVKIDSPCVIKVEPRKKTDSQDAKDRAEVARLKELLEQSKSENSKLWNERKILIMKTKEEVKE